ncbi:hypothetical protein BpHYR1_019330 [Brachionus plicatilis]|uniref:Uncharacterized protein n=1 Tax=Brachionus plicatilis TaxID=10195 RepID=A0A3M7QLW9_BRAPC|nr:hypothetical protein BpHYR1_019330 [Brachionus plicatilis]
MVNEINKFNKLTITNKFQITRESKGTLKECNNDKMLGEFDHKKWKMITAKNLLNLTTDDRI